MQNLLPKELQSHLNKASPLHLLDVRETWEFDIAHIPDSILIPVSDIPHRLSELNPAEAIVVICHHGIRSAKVALFLEQMGFKKVFNLQGGLDAWSRTVDLSMATY